MANPMDQLISKGAGKVHQIKARANGLIGVFSALAEQHGEAGALLKRLKADPSKRADLWPTIRAALTSHEQGELREVYPVFREYGELWSIADHHEREASQLSATIAQIDALGAETTEFVPLLYKLIRLVEAHVVEEEEKIFPMALQVIGDARARALEPRFLATAKQIKTQRTTLH
jgi:hemerythrin superfamily protein